MHDCYRPSSVLFIKQCIHAPAWIESRGNNVPILRLNYQFVLCSIVIAIIMSRVVNLQEATKQETLRMHPGHIKATFLHNG